MATAATIGYGATLKRLGDDLVTYTTIAEVKSIGGVDVAAEMLDATSLDSPALVAGNGFRERIPGLLSLGDIALVLNWLPTTATQSYTSGMGKDCVNRTKRTYKMTFSDGAATAWTFSAYVSKVTVPVAVGAIMEMSVTLSPTAAPTLAG